MKIYFLILIVLLVLYRYVGMLLYTIRNAGLVFREGRSCPALYLPKPQRFWEKKVWFWPLIKVKDLYDNIITKIFGHIFTERHLRKSAKIKIWEL